MPIDEPRLVRMAQKGDAAAWSTLFDQHYPAVFRYCYYRVGDTELAQDLAGEVFARMVEKLDSFEYRGRPLLTWLYTIARNLIVDRHRLDGQVTYLPLNEAIWVNRDGDGALERLAQRRWVGNCLMEALQSLTEEQRQVILLKFVEGYSNTEAAQLMGKTEGAIKALQHRALDSLRRLLEKTGCHEA